jgi:PAS domain S-box-containing protein
VPNIRIGGVVRSERPRWVSTPRIAGAAAAPTAHTLRPINVPRMLGTLLASPSLHSTELDYMALPGAQPVSAALRLLREGGDQVLNAIDDGVYVLDNQGNATFVNEAAARMLGFTPRELLGKPQHEMMHHHYADGTVFPREECPIYFSVTEGVQQRVGGDVFWKKDGEQLHVDYTSIPIKEGRQIVGVVVTFRDISAQRQVTEQASRLASERAARAEAEAARAALTRSEGRYRALVEAAGQFIWTNSPEGRMKGEQPGWIALTGQSQNEYEGFGWASAVHPDDSAPTIEAWNRAVAERRMFLFEHRVRRADGAYRMFVVRAVPILNEGGAIREWVGVHTDVTEQRQAFVDAQHARTELGRMLEQAPAAIATLNAQTLTFESANKRYRELVGGRDVVGKQVLDALPELVDQPFLIDMLKAVVRTGVPYVGEATPALLRNADGQIRERTFDFIYQPITQPNGAITAVMVHALEITK